MYPWKVLRDGKQVTSFDFERNAKSEAAGLERDYPDSKITVVNAEDIKSVKVAFQENSGYYQLEITVRITST